jgi:hypothetical protein
MPVTVTHHFGDYKPGDVITDSAAIEAILKSDSAGKIVRTAEPKEKEAEKETEKDFPVTQKDFPVSKHYAD